MRAAVVESGLERDLLVQLAVHQPLVDVGQRDLFRGGVTSEEGGVNDLPGHSDGGGGGRKPTTGESTSNCRFDKAPEIYVSGGMSMCRSYGHEPSTTQGSAVASCSAAKAGCLP